MNGKGAKRTISPPSKHVPPTAPRRLYSWSPNLVLRQLLLGQSCKQGYRGNPAAKADRMKLFEANALAVTGRYALFRNQSD